MTNHLNSRTDTSKCLYKPFDFFVARTPIIPSDVYAEYLKIDTGSDQVPLEYLQEFFQKPVHFKALFCASQSLAKTLFSDSGLSKIAFAKLQNYLNRYSTRPTPFGLFAGISLGKFGKNTCFRTSANLPLISTNIDLGFLFRLVLEIESRPDALKQLCVFANPACYFKAGRIYLSEKTLTKVDNARAISIRASTTIKSVLKGAQHPIPYIELLNQIQKTSGAEQEKLEKLIFDLTQQGVLLTELRMDLTNPNLHQKLISKISSLSKIDDLKKGLSQLIEARSMFDEINSDASIGTLKELIAFAQDNNLDLSRTIQADCKMELESNQLSQAISQEAARAAEVLLKTSLPKQKKASEWVSKFSDRYGSHRQVAILEVFDARCGIGIPELIYGYQNAQTGNHSERDRILCELATNALLKRERSVELTPEIVEQLTRRLNRLPESIEIYVQIVAQNRLAIDKGDYSLILSPHIGSNQAGKSIGRFGHLSDDVVSTLVGIAQSQEEVHEDIIYAELVYLPRELRYANVSLRPNARKYKILVDLAPGPNDAEYIHLKDLAIEFANGELKIIWTKNQKEVRIVEGHMLNLSTAPLLCRGLVAISGEQDEPIQGFHWGAAEDMPFLPRITNGRTILRPASWKLRSSQLDKRAISSSDEFAKALKSFCLDLKTPRFVYLSQYDNRLLIDLDRTFDIEFLRVELNHPQNKELVLEEAIPNFDELWNENDQGKFFTEIVVPLKVQHNLVPNRAGSRNLLIEPIQDIDRLKMPGSDWLYVKIYPFGDFFDEVLLSKVAPLADRLLELKLVDKWFFVRYDDPSHHLRVRFHGDPKNLLEHVIPRICEVCEQMRKEEILDRFTFDTYEREIGRYGGVHAMEVVEEYFSIDSSFVCRLLDSCLQLPVPIYNVGMGTVRYLLECFGMNQRERVEWYYKQVKGWHEVGERFRQSKNDLRAYLDKDNDLNFSDIYSEFKPRFESVSTKLTELARETSLSRDFGAILRSLIHMHFNRLVAEQEEEEQIISLLYRLEMEDLNKQSSQLAFRKTSK